jgi:site-specific recombinase XerD
VLGQVDINDNKFFERANDYVNQRLDEGASDRTVQKELITLRQALKLAHKRGLMRQNPTAIVPSFSAEYVPKCATSPTRSSRGSLRS